MRAGDVYPCLPIGFVVNAELDTAGEEKNDSLAPLDSEAVSEDWRHANAILCVPSRTPLDETAALALAQLLTRCGLGAKIITLAETRRGALTDEQLEGTRLICLVSIDVREHSAHARFMARRLRRSAPKAWLMGGFFALDPHEQRDRDLVETIPLDEVAYSLKDALRVCLNAAKSVTPPRGHSTLRLVTPAHS